MMVGGGTVPEPSVDYTGQSTTGLSSPYSGPSLSSSCHRQPEAFPYKLIKLLNLVLLLFAPFWQRMLAFPFWESYKGPFQRKRV